MPFRRLAAVALACVALACPAAFASNATVPGTHTTIQAAIDSGVDTVLVGDGVFEERLRLRRSLCLLPIITDDGLDVTEAGPAVRGIANVDMQPFGDRGAKLLMRGMRFLGAVDLHYEGIPGALVEIERCRFDSAFVGPHSSSTSQHLTIRGCMIFGSLNLMVGYFQFTGNAVIGGGLEYWGDGTGIVRDNDFSGPGPFGLRLSWSDNAAIVERNTVHGFDNGIELPGQGYTVRDNRVTDCTRDGIVLLHDFGGARRVTGNTVLRCGRHGIYSPHCVGYACTYPFIVGNTIGRCGSDGVRLEGGLNFVQHNTTFANQGAGIVIGGNYGVDSLANNIAAFNGGPGLVWSAPIQPHVMTCNDWFGNGGGATAGIAPAPGDVQLDPMFCALATDDVRLASASPLLSLAGCGQVGAQPQGCISDAAARPAATGPGFILRSSPVPGRGGAVFALPSLTAPAELEVFDVTGARRWSTSLGAGTRAFEWRGVSHSGQPLAAGVYFARLTGSRGETSSVRVVLAP